MEESKMEDNTIFEMENLRLSAVKKSFAGSALLFVLVIWDNFASDITYIPILRVFLGVIYIMAYYFIFSGTRNFYRTKKITNDEYSRHIELKSCYYSYSAIGIFITFIYILSKTGLKDILVQKFDKVLFLLLIFGSIFYWGTFLFFLQSEDDEKGLIGFINKLTTKFKKSGDN